MSYPDEYNHQMKSISHIDLGLTEDEADALIRTAMTAPDVAALAAALCEMSASHVHAGPNGHTRWHERRATAIIAALAAQGWYLAQPDTTEALEQAAVRAALEELDRVALDYADVRLPDGEFAIRRTLLSALIRDRINNLKTPNK